jgi:hypothetical protein
MPDQYENLNRLMNSDGMGGFKHVNGRNHGWAPGWDTALPPNHQVLSGFCTNEGRQVAATVIVQSTLAFDAADASLLVRWFKEDGKLHQSAKTSGTPPGYLGYVHDYARNRLFAVTGMDEAAGVITIPKTGKVNDGWHRF